jgi:hypothetical protein
MLISKVHSTDESTLEDFLLIKARHIELSLLGTGAKPGTDYTIVDLYALAVPFAVEACQKGQVTYETQYF